jgi:hypothetical protein
MNKSLVALFAAFIAAATIFSSAAEAGLRIHFGFGGFSGHHGGGISKRHYHRKRYIVRRVAKKQKVYVAKRKTTSEPKVAKVEQAVAKPVVVAALPVIEPDVIADSENSSITTASLEPVENTASVGPETVAPVEVKADATKTTTSSKPERAASKLDCKKFFPSVGMTLSVPCE